MYVYVSGGGSEIFVFSENFACFVFLFEVRPFGLLLTQCPLAYGRYLCDATSFKDVKIRGLVKTGY